MKGIVVSAVLLITVGMVSTGNTAGPSAENFSKAYKLILSQADANKDGRLSVDECKTGYKDKAMAEKNCTFWDVDKDGVITEDEYVKQAASFGNKKQR